MSAWANIRLRQRGDEPLRFWIQSMTVWLPRPSLQVPQALRLRESDPGIVTGQKSRFPIGLDKPSQLATFDQGRAAPKEVLPPSKNQHS
jgi:hypothetical protein